MKMSSFLLLLICKGLGEQWFNESLIYKPDSKSTIIWPLKHQCQKEQNNPLRRHDCDATIKKKLYSLGGFPLLNLL